MHTNHRILALFLSVLILILAAGCANATVEESSNGSTSTTNSGTSETGTTASSSSDTKTGSEETTVKNQSSGTKTQTTTKSSLNSKPLSDSVSTWTVNSLTDIFPDTAEPSNAQKSIQLDMAKNEYESAQIAIRSTQDVGNVKITFENAKTGAPLLTARPIGYVHCTNSSGNGDYPGPSAYFRTKAGGQTYPAEFPEYYINSNSIPVLKANETISFVIEAYASQKTAAGTYTANAVISSDSGTRKIPVSIRVYNVTLPNAAQSSFAYSCWSDSNTHAEMFRTWYSAELYTEEYWNIIANFSKSQKKQRQNCLWVPLTSILKSDMTISSDGTYNFSFKNFDKYIQTSLSNGDYKYIEGSQLMGKDWSGDFTPQKENGPGIVEIYQGTGSNISTKYVLYSDASAKKHLRQMLTALANHLKQKGWDKMWIQHGLDECFDLQVQIPQAIDLVNMIKEIMPFAKTVDAGSVYSVMAKYNFPCPRIDFYESEKGKYDELNKSSAADLWLYADTGARGDILFRGQDYPLISTRAIGWYSYLNKATGYLHWAWNLWDWTGLDPFSEMANKHGPTDTYLVYPDMINMTVMESTRSTAVRDGFEDYELLKLAESKNPTKTKSVINELVIDQRRFQRSASEFAALRIQLLKVFG